MKSGFIDSIILYSLIIIAICVVAKFFFFIQSKSSRKMGFIKTFIIFFSIHDIHNASSIQSKKFRRNNNTINYIFWGLIVLLIICYIYNTPKKVDTNPTNQQRKR
jgi:hypothetical protein